MNRRGFLKSLAAAVAGVAAYEADPERLLWVPGAKTFFLPPAKPVELAPAIVSGDDVVPYIDALSGQGVDAFEDPFAWFKTPPADDICVDMTERSYTNAVGRGSTFNGISRVRVFDGHTLLAEHGGNVPDLALLRDKLHGIDARRARLGDHDRVADHARFLDTYFSIKEA